MSLVVGCLICVYGNVLHYLPPSKSFPSQLLSPTAANEEQSDISLLLQHLNEQRDLANDHYYDVELSFKDLDKWHKDRWIVFSHQRSMLTICIINCIPSHIYWYDKAEYHEFIDSLKPITGQIHDDIHATFNDYAEDYDPTDSDNVNEVPLYILRIRCKTILFHHLSQLQDKKYKYSERSMERTANNMIASELRKNERESRTKKIILIGAKGAGKTTILTQLWSITMDGFENMEKELKAQYIDKISLKCILQMKHVMHYRSKYMDTMDEKEEKMNQDVVEAMRLITDIANRGTLNMSVINAIQTIWNWLKNTPFWLKLCTNNNTLTKTAHFWEESDKIVDDTYALTKEDILWLWEDNDALHEIKYEVRDNTFRIMEIPQKYETRKYIHQFESVSAFNFIVDLSCYNESYYADETVNAMDESLELFTEVCNSKWFRRSERILMLNKDALFREKIKHHPLNECPSFKEFDLRPDVLSGLEGDEYEQAFDDYYNQCISFIQNQFVSRNEIQYQVVFCHVINALDKDSIQKVYWDVQNIIIRCNLKRGGLMGGPSITLPSISMPKVTFKRKKVVEPEVEMRLERKMRAHDRTDEIIFINLKMAATDEICAPIEIEDEVKDVEEEVEEDSDEEELKVSEEKEEEELKPVVEILQTYTEKKKVRFVNIFAVLSKKIEEWKAARKLIDNVFADLENMFYLLAQLLLMIELQSFSDRNNAQHEDDTAVNASKQSKVSIVLLNIFKIVITPLVYLLVIIIAVFVILPSCFFLLIVRMNKVETDTVKLSKRAKQIYSETSWQRCMRVMNQLLRASFMFAFLVIYPIFIVYIIIPSAGTDNDLVIIASISSYLFTILLLQLFGTYRSIKSFEERKKLKPNEKRYEPKKFIFNIGSIIAILMMVYEVFQLTIFAYQTTTDGGQPQNHEDEQTPSITAESIGINSEKLVNFASATIKICYLSLDFIENNILEYYVLFSCIAVGSLLSFFIFRFIFELKTYARLKWKENNADEAKEIYFHSFLGTIIYGHGRLKNVNKWNSKIISLLADALFLGICQKIVLILSCDEQQRLRIDLSTKCWVDEHKLYAAISLILLGFYIPICTMIAPMFSEDIEEEKEDENEDIKEEETSAFKQFASFTNTISFVSPFMSALTVTECFMLISSQFVSKGTAYGTIVSQSIAMVLLLLFTINWSFNNLQKYGLTQNEPAFPFGISMIRNVGFLCGFIGCILEILRFNRVIDIGLELFILFLFVMISTIIAFIVFKKYHAFFNPLDDETDVNLIIKYYKNEKKIELINMKKETQEK